MSLLLYIITFRNSSSLRVIIKCHWMSIFLSVIDCVICISYMLIYAPLTWAVVLVSYAIDIFLISVSIWTSLRCWTLTKLWSRSIHFRDWTSNEHLFRIVKNLVNKIAKRAWYVTRRRTRRLKKTKKKKYKIDIHNSLINFIGIVDHWQFVERNVCRYCSGCDSVRNDAFISISRISQDSLKLHNILVSVTLSYLEQLKC